MTSRSASDPGLEACILVRARADCQMGVIDEVLCATDYRVGESFVVP